VPVISQEVLLRIFWGFVRLLQRLFESLRQSFSGVFGGRMVRSSSQMDNSILFAEFLELVRLEGSSAVGYDCMGKTEMREILLQEFDR